LSEGGTLELLSEEAEPERRPVEPAGERSVPHLLSLHGKRRRRGRDRGLSL